MTQDGTKVYCSQPVMVAITELKPNPANPNMHPDEQLRLLAKALKEGWREPITVSNRSGLIVRGHGRLLAAKAMGETHVPVDYQDYESEAEEMADLVRDNELARQSAFYLPQLKDILSVYDVGAMDMELFGMPESRLEELLAGGSFDPVEDIESVIGEYEDRITRDKLGWIVLVGPTESIATLRSSLPPLGDCKMDTTDGN